MKARVTVLYEDRRGPQKRFGPHELVVAMVADATGQEQQQAAKLVSKRSRPDRGRLSSDRCGFRFRPGRQARGAARSFWK